ncbi:hypothetical protein VTK56DRAFT_2984 [Thermocarpiscus australiensis]
MTDKSVWDHPIPVPEEVIQYVDRGVRDKLPPGTKVREITQSGSSYWARTAEIDATDEAGNPTPFFLKVHQFGDGKDMVSAEYRAMTLLHRVMPEMVAKPLAWGPYTERPDTYFFLCRFHELSKIPKASGDGEPRDQQLAGDFRRRFVSLVAEFHRRGKSETGEFGFAITMYGGRNPQTFPLAKSWEECFSRGLNKIFGKEEETQRPDEEMRQLRGGLMTKMIPRLLRPLETEGRTLTPTLVHGDL